MKLSDLGNTPPKTFDFLDPYTNEPTGIKVTVHPIKSKYGKQCQHDMYRRVAELMQDENNIVETDGKKQLNEDLIKQVSYEQWANMIVSWSGIEDEHGNAIEFTHGNAMKCFNESSEFANAIAAFSSNLGNFRKA